jgi:hypothetical protein
VTNDSRARQVLGLVALVDPKDLSIQRAARLPDPFPGIRGAAKVDPIDPAMVWRFHLSTSPASYEFQRFFHIQRSLCFLPLRQGQGTWRQGPEGPGITTRNPISLSEPPGSSLLRWAQRTSCGPPRNDPPRPTRWIPDFGPCGLSCGDEE